MSQKSKSNTHQEFETVKPKIRIIEHFQEVEDPLIERSQRHLLSDIITIAILAVICGVNDWVAVAKYGQAKHAWLKTFLDFPNGIPSHDTFGDVFARLNPEQLQSCFLNWVRSVSRLTEGEVIAIDEVRRSYDQGAIHMVSAWASQNRLVLGQRKVDEKSNEITTIPELLRVLDLYGCTSADEVLLMQCTQTRRLQSKLSPEDRLWRKKYGATI